MERDCTFNCFFRWPWPSIMSVKGQGQMQKKKLNFTLRQFFVAWKKVSATPLSLIMFENIYFNCTNSYFILLGTRTKYLVIEVQAIFQKFVHWAIIQVSPLFFFQTLVLSLNHHKSYFFKLIEHILMPSETITFIPFFCIYKKRQKKRRHKFPFFRPQFHVYTSEWMAQAQLPVSVARYASTCLSVCLSVYIKKNYLNYLNYLSIKFKLCRSFSQHFAIFRT